MIYVTWYDADAYAKWAGKRLPTEEEWEFSARGRLIGKEFTWGNDASLTRDYANCFGTGGKDKWDYCSPVGSFKPNGYGLHDMTGNVYERVQDQGLLIGGSWSFDTAGPPRMKDKRFWHIDYSPYGPTMKDNYQGFRCVVSGLN